MTRVVVFGTFDGLHAGHRAFLQQARALGDELIVLLPPDHAVETLKEKPPKFDFDERKTALEALPEVSRVVAGDEEIGTYRALQEITPDIVAFGYDQRALKDDFTAWKNGATMNVIIHELQPFEPETYKSSLLNYD